MAGVGDEAAVRRKLGRVGHAASVTHGRSKATGIWRNRQGEESR